MEENITITKPSGERIEIYIQGEDWMNGLIYHSKETFVDGGRGRNCEKTWIIIRGHCYRTEAPLGVGRCETWGTIPMEKYQNDGSVCIDIWLGGHKYWGIILQRERNRTVTVYNYVELGDIVLMELD